MNSTLPKDFPDRISKIFIGKNILVTGGTGFVGKVFIEKIIRMCPEVQCLYLLAREKRGKDPQTRLKEYFAGAVSCSLVLPQNFRVNKGCSYLTLLTEVDSVL